MAELIPSSYRTHVAQRRAVARWVLTVAAVTIVCGVSLVYALFWDAKCEKEFNALDFQHRQKSALIVRSQESRARRQELAGRMQKIQQLMDDELVLSLLRNVSSGCPGRNALEYIAVDGRGPQSSDPSKADDGKAHYSVRITGITENSATLAELMTRLGRHSDPQVNVVLESSRRETLMDGQVMRFQIVCEPPQKAGA